MFSSNVFNTPKSCSSPNKFFPTSTKRPEKWDEFEFFKVFLRIRNMPSLPKSSFIIRKVDSSTIRITHGKETKEFVFDYIFGESEDTKYLFTQAIQPSIESLFQGFNSTVMAYGMTGSGKTFTMLGEIQDINIIDHNPGLIFLSVKDIFWRIHLENAMDKNWDFILQMSYLEIYNEQIHDLLSEKQMNLQVLEDPDRGPVVQGLIEKTIKSPQEIIELINAGNTRRVVAETTSNRFSSRSHAILMLSIQKKNRVIEPNKVIHGKLVMADLAGSERACASGNKGVRMMEGGNINRSLLALGNCIKMLSEKAPKVNYRDSKLTRLLKESLGGNSRTIMLACLSPLDVHYEESLNTLKYADRMKKIKVKTSKNIKEEIMDMEMAIKIDEEHRLLSLNTFSNNLQLNLEEVIEINNKLKGMREKNNENLDLLRNERLSSESRKRIEEKVKESSMEIQNFEIKFQEKCKEKESLFKNLLDQFGVNHNAPNRSKDLQIQKLNKEIERLKSELKEKNKLLQSQELPLKPFQHINTLKSPNSGQKPKPVSFYPKNISEIRKYYKMNSKFKFSEDIHRNFLSNKKQKNFKYTSKSSWKNHDQSNTQPFSNQTIPNHITKYQDFKVVFKEKGKNAILPEKTKKNLPLSDMSSINQDERLSIDSFIFDKDIDEHHNDIIEMKKFIKKDSKLQCKNEASSRFSPQLKSLNTTHQLNITQKLFNEGYYSEEIENVKGRRKMYKSVRDLIKRQREHLNEEYQKLGVGNNLQNLIMSQIAPSNETDINYFTHYKFQHS